MEKPSHTHLYIAVIVLIIFAVLVIASMSYLNKPEDLERTLRPTTAQINARDAALNDPSLVRKASYSPEEKARLWEIMREQERISNPQ